VGGARVGPAVQQVNDADRGPVEVDAEDVLRRSDQARGQRREQGLGISRAHGTTSDPQGVSRCAVQHVLDGVDVLAVPVELAQGDRHEAR
jgi:hypothetical protein